MADYRDALRARGRRPMTDSMRAKLRTHKEPGTIEIVRDPRVEEGWRVHRYDGPLSEGGV